jgi:hypothetical protein
MDRHRLRACRACRTPARTCSATTPLLERPRVCLSDVPWLQTSGENRSIYFQSIVSAGACIELLRTTSSRRTSEHYQRAAACERINGPTDSQIKVHHRHVRGILSFRDAQTSRASKVGQSSHRACTVPGCARAATHAISASHVGRSHLNCLSNLDHITCHS